MTLTTELNIAETETPVLVIGAGPAGLVTAVALGRAGIETVLVERRQGLSPLPKATTESVRTMELLRHWGLEEAAREQDPGVDWLCWTAESLARAEHGWAVELGVPSRAQSELVSPTTPGCIPQDHLEPVLLEHLRSLGTCDVRFGAELVGFDSAEQGVIASVRGPDGSAGRIHARYLVGADGGRSAVRDLAGIGMEVSGTEENAVSAMFRAPLWDLVADRRYGMYASTQPEATGIFLPAGRGDRWIYGLIVPPGNAADEVGADEMARQIRIAAGLSGFEPRIDRLGRFAFEAGLAETFRAGDAFLVGDAAHRVTPRGGTGMNMAIHGAFDLGWKLGWVLRGWAPDSLLDTYERERMPVVRHNVERSKDERGSIRAAVNELSVDLGGRIPHVWIDGPEGRLSTLDLVGEGLTRLVADPAEWIPADEGEGPPVEVRGVGWAGARALGLEAGGAVLVRPDARPVAWLPGAAGLTPSDPATPAPFAAAPAPLAAAAC